MPKLPRLNSQEAEAILLRSGFQMVRGKGSHRIYMKGNRRIVVPFHGNKILHPKIIKQVLRAIEVTEDT
ncbi:MAG: type II toxin-antitoxin system HicA family toxin [Nitrospirae bacterium]|nr:type II toxin-antitoxin system HicA family toxin [Nitrospirota bacterium]